MTEIGKRQVEEVDDNQQLSQPEMIADPEMDETKEEKVGSDVVRANVGCGSDIDGVLGVQAPRVDELQNEQNDPVAEA